MGSGKQIENFSGHVIIPPVMIHALEYHLEFGYV